MLEPISDDVPTQFSGLANRMPPAAAGSHPSATHFRLKAVRHDAAALPQGVAGAPQTISANTIEHCIDAFPGKAMDLLHEVGVLVIDGNAAHFTNHCCPLRRARSVHLYAGQLR